MSEDLVPICFPLSGSRLIEASAGTGKTWTIAALYVRLVLGHGGDQAFTRPLLPAEILVMTFTKAATRELCERVRERLVDAARCFRDPAQAAKDPFLQDLLAAYPGDAGRAQAAHRLAMAADAMDDAAIMTIDAWCQRMLREHAFDSGCLFDESLVASESVLFREAVRDYWRTHVYSLDPKSLQRLRACWSDLTALESAIGSAVDRASLFKATGPALLNTLINAVEAAEAADAAGLKTGWEERVARLRTWYAAHRADFDGRRLQPATVAKVLAAIEDWARDPEALRPDKGFAHAGKLAPAFLRSCLKGGSLTVNEDLEQVALLQRGVAALESVDAFFIRHAAVTIAARIGELKARRRQFGFADLLSRLRQALEGENAAALRSRIVAQFPIAMIDEFQDTSPDQYRIFNLLYRVTACDAATALLMIGDPKQAIYGFRGADIHSYLAARRATEGRHYRLGTNYRSTNGVVGAINHLFSYAEGKDQHPGHEKGAFGFRDAMRNPLPFEPVAAQGRQERFIGLDGAQPPLTIWCNTEALSAGAVRDHFAAQCAQTIAALLASETAGFESEDGFTALQQADIAVLVRNWREAEAVQAALRARKVASVYLSDKDSLFESAEAADVLRWLRAIASPLDGALARTALATRTVGLSVAALADLARDDGAWDAQVERLKALRVVWQRQGVLAMLRRFVHELGVPARLLREPGGERVLTNLLHLAELCQAANHRLDGEQALIRWLAEQIDDDSHTDDERILRLESDAQLVKVVTVHKAKGLEYPLVFLPYATSARKMSRRNRLFVELADADGRRYLDFGLDDQSMDTADAGRLEEELRILYVALTRSRHAIWAGVTSVKDKLHESAFGYLLSGGEPVTNAQLAGRLAAMCSGSVHVSVEPTCEPVALTCLTRGDAGAALCVEPLYQAGFERDWAVASYSGIVRHLAHAPAGPSVPRPLGSLGKDDENEAAGAGVAQGDVWHRFPRGNLPGQFLHDQLEWMACEGFADTGSDGFAIALGARCVRAGWGHRQDDTVAWMRAVANATLGPLGRSLALLTKTVPEMEFWMPASGIDVAALDRHCSTHLLDGVPRPRLQAAQLHGMLHGYMDLVCECDGRYWVIDYKSSMLGTDDAAYHAAALAACVATHRYDVQAAIYVRALERLLQVRLGGQYDPARHLGGVIFFFLRGIGNTETGGCFHMPPDAPLLSALGPAFQPVIGEAA